ncbi:MAG: phosphatase PAP2 family protein [Thermomicrobiales bacterium]
MSSRTGTILSRTAPPGLRGALLTPVLLALVAVCLICAALFAGLGAEVHDAGTLPTDQRVLHSIDDHTASWPVALPNDVSLIAGEVETAIIGLALAVWLFLRRRWLDALLFVGAVGGYGVLTLLVKQVMARERPIAFFRVPESGYGFPSGHTMGATCLAFALGFLLWRSTARPGLKSLGTVALVVGVAAIALSRLILGVHYPTDVLGSILLGTAWMSGLIALRFAVERWLVLRTTDAPRTV